MAGVCLKEKGEKMADFLNSVKRINELPKVYLGDGVYASFDGYAIELTTENGIETTNTILLEPEVYEALEQYAHKCVIGG